MEPNEPRPMFSQVGRSADTPTDARSRAFHIVILAGVLIGAVALLAELASRPTVWTYVEVEMNSHPDPSDP